MYPNTRFKIVDNSATPPLPIVDSVTKPIYLTGFTSDKGPEDYVFVEGSPFFDIFGSNISFARHGQPLLQAAVSINAGAILLARRVVAEDSLLANVGLVGHVFRQQKKDQEGNNLYLDITDPANPVETTSQTNAAGDDNAPVVIMALKYSTVTTDFVDETDGVTVLPTNDPTVVDSKLVTAALVGFTAPTQVELDDPTWMGEVYRVLLYTFTDVGRGVSNKKWTIAPDRTIKSNSFMTYSFSIIEDNSMLETWRFNFHPNSTNGITNTSLGNVLKDSNQMRAVQNDVGLEDFIAVISTELDIDATDLITNYDVMFMLDKKGYATSTLKGAIVDTTDPVITNVVNITSQFGIDLTNGNNGSFGTAPISAAGYNEAIKKVFDGSLSNVIYDRDNYKVDAIIDANYDASVKSTIAKYCTWRQDCFYFRDMGLNINSLETLKAAYLQIEVAERDMFNGIYHNSYQVIDPYSKKPITVTIGYSLAKLLVAHFVAGRTRPLAGLINSFTITDAIEGTLNFTPMVTPEYDEKEEVDDIRVNYAGYYNNQLVLETLYTSQESLTEFSYINNILAVQEIIKAIRTICPLIRYQFIAGEGLDKYTTDVQKVLNRYEGNFDTLTLTYGADAVWEANKVYYALLDVKFKQFVQSEYFVITALPVV